jgi:hypothetical protein
MKRLSVIIGLAVLGLLVGYQMVFAQESGVVAQESAGTKETTGVKEPSVKEKEEAVYDSIYNRERFNRADTNGDGVLSKAELKAAQKDFEHYRDAARFRHADTNGDGVISLEEAKAERNSEMTHRRELQKKAKKDIGKKKEAIKERREDVVYRRDSQGRDQGLRDRSKSIGGGKGPGYIRRRNQ